jgi:hypothetical protein
LATKSATRFVVHFSWITGCTDNYVAPSSLTVIYFTTQIKEILRKNATSDIYTTKMHSSFIGYIIGVLYRDVHL